MANYIHVHKTKENTDHIAKETKEIPERVYTGIFSIAKICACILDINIQHRPWFNQWDELGLVLLEHIPTLPSPQTFCWIFFWQHQ